MQKESDVFLVQGDTVVSIKSSDVQIGDVLVLSQGNEILFDGQVVSGLGMVNESSLTGESFPVEKESLIRFVQIQSWRLESYVFV